MLGDKKQVQRQSQQTSQAVNINGEGPSKISCPHYTDDVVQAIETELKKEIATAASTEDGSALGLGALNDALKKAREVDYVAHEGCATAIMCRLLDTDGYKCLSPKYKGQRCLLRGPAPASGKRAEFVNSEPYDPFRGL